MGLSSLDKMGAQAL